MMRFIGFSLVITTFISCQKTIDAPPIETPVEDSICRIIQMRQGALDIYDSISNYVYDDQNRLITIMEESPDDGARYAYHFEYDGLSRVKRILHKSPDFQSIPNSLEIITKADYEYNGNRLEKIKVEDYFIPMLMDITFEYDNSGEVLKTTFEGIYSTYPFKDYITYEYDVKGNISKKRIYYDGTLARIKEYLYNDDDNIVKAFGLGTESIVGYELSNVLDEDAYLNTNNLISVVEKWPDGRIISKSEITYIRDINNRIIRVDSKRVVGAFSPGVFNYHFFYQCK